MDPISQAAVGAIASGFAQKKRRKHVALAIGVAALGGLAPDLDVLLRSDTDPLFGLEYHRHFTHALLMIPAIGAFVAAGLWLFLRRRFSFISLFVLASLGAATHGILDALTSYGTLIFWPFSYERISIDYFAIIDFKLTLPLLAFIFWAIIKKSWRPIYYSWAFTALFLCSQAGMYYYGKNLQENFISSRGHSPTQVRLMPELLGNGKFRSAYVYKEKIHVDWLNIFAQNPWRQGYAIPKLSKTDLNALASLSDIRARDVARFTWFADGFTALYQSPSGLVLGDYRYFGENGKPLWGIRIDIDKNQHTPFIRLRTIQHMVDDYTTTKPTQGDNKPAPN